MCLLIMSELRAFLSGCGGNPQDSQGQLLAAEVMNLHSVCMAEQKDKLDKEADVCKSSMVLSAR